MIELKFTGTADEIGAAMARLFTVIKAESVPAVSGLSSDKPEIADINDTGPVPTPAPKPRRGRPAKAETKLPEGPALNVVKGQSASDFAKIDVSQAHTVEAEQDKAEQDKADQDEADEAAETEANKAETGKTYTLTDVKNAAGLYVAKFTIEAAQVDLMPVLEKATGVTQISKLDANDQAQLKAAADAFTAAAAADKRAGQ